MAAIHSSPFCGTWFPAEQAGLRDLLDSLAQQSRQRTGPFLAESPAAFVVPHAALVYSGAVASAAYRCLRRRHPERVVLLGFSHARRHRGIAIPQLDAYRTPLGEVAIDTALAGALDDSPMFHKKPEAPLCDHSLEVQLPLLQDAVPNAKLLPLYVGELNDRERGAAAAQLAALIDERTVLIASSDFTHYGSAFHFVPFPCDDQVAGRLRDMDAQVAESAGSLDSSLFLRALEESGSTTCGSAPIALLLETLRRINGEELFQETLDYQTSGEITGDFRHSVSYAALGYFPLRSFQLGPQDRRALLDSAGRTLATLTSTGRGRPEPPRGGTPSLQRKAGVFVTLYQRGELRGCIGNVISRRSLAETVPELALSAATEDPRFPPVKRGESGFSLDISVLTPLKRIDSPLSVEAGVHGAVIEAHGRRGVLLPQVASNRNWTRERFLEGLAAKCGLPASAIDEPSTRLSVFRAQVIQ